MADGEENRKLMKRGAISLSQFNVLEKANIPVNLHLFISRELCKF